MDLKEWQGWVGAGLLTVVGFIFGNQKYKRQDSADRVEETRNQAESNVVLRLEAEVERLTKRGHEAMQEAQVNKELYFVEQARAKKLELVVMDNEYRITALDRENKHVKVQLERLAGIIARIHPDSSVEIQESLYGTL